MGRRIFSRSLSFYVSTGKSFLLSGDFFAQNLARFASRAEIFLSNFWPRGIQVKVPLSSLKVCLK